MTRFFDWCNKHTKALQYALLFVVFICLFFPVYKGNTTGAFLAPYLISFLFDSRLNFTIDGYIRDTKNMLTTSLTLPDVYGANTPKANCANLRSKGWELTLSWNDSFPLLGRPFTYNVSATLGDYVTHITKYHNPDGLISDHYVGEKLGDIWGYHVEGLFKTDREAAEYQATIDDTAVNNRVYQCTGPAGNRLRAGDVRFADLDGDKKITEGSGTLDDHGDQIIILSSRV